MTVRQPEKRRAIGTNNPRKIAGVDMKSGHGRRFADIMTMLSLEYVGLDPVALREIAGLKLTAEICQRAVIEGDRRARGDLVRVSNLIARREKTLRDQTAKERSAAPAQSIRDLLAEHEVRRAS